MMVTGFKKGELPFRHLGIPLPSRRISYHQCVSLVGKITSRIRYWSSHSLSYARRVQLIKNVLYATTNY